MKMHSGSSVIIVLVLILADAWTHGHSLEDVQREARSTGQIQVNYLVSEESPDGRWQSDLEHYKQLGTATYVFRNELLILSNGSLVFSEVFVSIGNRPASYQYRFFAKPSTAPDLLKQLSSQGAKGFRLKTYLFNDTTTLLVSVRDTSRPSAKYSYRYGQCVSSLDALFAQINTNAAQGYRLYGPLRLENSCQIFIKDKSRKSTFVYEMVPNPDTLKNFLAEANQLGARGYRHAGDTLADLSSSGTDFYSTFPLYYRDKTQKGCTFFYSSVPLPDSINKVHDLFQEQAGKGFTFLKSFRQPPTKFAIFMNMTNCRYGHTNIEDTY